MPIHQEKDLVSYTCKVTKSSISHTPAVDPDETPPGLRVFPIREGHNPLQIPRLLPRVTSKKWRAATFHFRPGGLFMMGFGRKKELVDMLLDVVEEEVLWR